MNELCLMSNLSSGDVAAWAQAVVSTAAIAVGALALVWQVRRQRRDALHTAWQAKHDLASSAAVLLAEAKTKLVIARDAANDAEVLRAYIKNGTFEQENWPGLVDELDELDLRSLSRPHVSMSVRSARRAVRSGFEVLQDLASQPTVLAEMRHPRALRELSLSVARVDDALGTVARVVNDLTARLD